MTINQSISGREAASFLPHLFLALLFSCSYKQFEFTNGTKVYCKDFFAEPCGYTLALCKDGKEYLCMRGVIMSKEIDKQFPEAERLEYNFDQCPFELTKPKQALPISKPL